MGYGVRVVWSELVYATICSGASSMLARPVLAVIEIGIYGLWFPIAYCGAFGGREIIGALKIRRDPYQT